MTLLVKTERNIFQPFVMIIHIPPLGLVEADFYHDHGANDFLKELKEQVKDAKESASQNSDIG